MHCCTAQTGQSRVQLVGRRVVGRIMATLIEQTNINQMCWFADQLEYNANAFPFCIIFYKLTA